MAGEISKEDIEYFLAIGALELSHINDEGEKVYHLTETAKEIAPQLYEKQMKGFNEILFSLWNKGVLDLSFDEDGEPLISLNEDTESLLEKNILDEEEKEVMEQIVLSWFLKKME
jgi:hypothetical protein